MAHLRALYAGTKTTGDTTEHQHTLVLDQATQAQAHEVNAVPPSALEPADIPPILVFFHRGQRRPRRRTQRAHQRRQHAQRLRHLQAVGARAAESKRAAEHRLNVVPALDKTLKAQLNEQDEAKQRTRTRVRIGSHAHTPHTAAPMMARRHATKHTVTADSDQPPEGHPPTPRGSHSVNTLGAPTTPDVTQGHGRGGRASKPPKRT